MDDDETRQRFGRQLRAELDDIRAASRETMSDRAPVELDQQSVGRLSRMDALQNQAMAAAQEARRAGRIRAIEAALHRIETDEFGWCETCGEPIGEKRLELDPTLTRCVGCAR